MLSHSNSSKILVFLPENVGTTIVAGLSEQGLKSVLVSTIPEAFDALRSDEFIFAITTRPDIDLLRSIRALPVINLEVFLHAGVSSDGSPVKSKRFDSKAFLERVEFLARASSNEKPEAGAGRAKALPVLKTRNVRWWTRAANALGLCSRKDTMDVASR